MKLLIPDTVGGRLLLMVSIGFTAAIYGIRIFLNDLIVDNAMGMLLCPLVILSLIAAVGYLGVTVIYAFKPGGHPAPLIVFVLGGVLALTFPTPPPYEQRIFASHRKQYEQLVTLARDHQLSHSPACTYNRTFETPAEYKKLSQDCIDVDYQPYFSVQFAPRVYVESIVYINDPARIKEVWVCKPSLNNRYKQLDENWFLCSVSP